MNKKILGLVLAIAGLVLVPGAQASFLIDDYADFSLVAVGFSINNPTLLTNSDFSASRDISIATSGPSPSATVDDAVLEMGISNGTGDTSVITSEYASASGGDDFTFTENSGDTDGLGNILTNTFAIDFLSGDVDTSTIILNLIVTDSSLGEGIAEHIIDTADIIDNDHLILLSYSSFVGAVDFTSVTGIVLNISSGSKQDSVYANFRAYGAEAAVPEPVPLILLTSAFLAYRSRQHTRREKYIST